jgi:hypothetical protein
MKDFLLYTSKIEEKYIKVKDKLTKFKKEKGGVA